MPMSTIEGIILKRKNYGEADRILTILTPYRGKISIVAKGVRRITSRRAGSVEVLNRVTLHVFQGKGLPILTEAQSINTFPKIKDDLILSTYGSHLIELVDRLIPDQQINLNAYNLILTALTFLEESPRQIWVRAFEIKLLSDLGFYSSKEVETTPEMKNLLNKLLNLPWVEIAKIKLNSESALELERILRYYIEKILESPLRSVQVMEKIKNGEANR